MAIAMTIMATVAMAAMEEITTGIMVAITEIITVATTGDPLEMMTYMTILPITKKFVSMII